MPTFTARIEKLEHAYERIRQVDQEIYDLLAQLAPDEGERIICEVAREQGIE